jgi:thiamine biosynthesis lipoprotein
METKELKRDFQLEKIDSGYRGSFGAMASPCEVLIETDDAKLASEITKIAASEAWRIEQKFSRYRDDNILYQIHHAEGKRVEVDEELSLLLDFAQQCYQLSNGLFDISSGVLRRIWTFDCSDNVPTHKQSKALLKSIGWQKITWQPPFITVPKGMEIDLGGLGKEYAVDKAGKLAAEATDEPVLINFGGDLFATQPPHSRDAWHVGIETIGGSNKTGLIKIKSGGVATSGDEKRYLERDGKRYSHVLNPKTGRSIANAPKSVTVASPTCIEAGFLSTLAMLHGKEARSFLKAQDVLFWIQE